MELVDNHWHFIKELLERFAAHYGIEEVAGEEMGGFGETFTNSMRAGYEGKAVIAHNGSEFEQFLSTEAYRHGVKHREQESKV